MSEITIEDKKCKTPKARASFVTLDKPRAFGDSEAKFSATFLIDKSTDLSAPPKNKAGKAVGISMIQALKNAAVEKWGANADLMIAKIKKQPKGWPIRDGDKEKPDRPEYEGQYFIVASAKEDKPPGLVDRERNKIEASQIYSGCYVRGLLLCYAYDNQFGKGFGFSLQGIQKTGDGPKFGGAKDVAKQFDEIEDESDDPDSYEEAPATGDDDGMGF